MKKKKKLRGILGRKKAMRARHGKQTCFFFWPNSCQFISGGCNVGFQMRILLIAIFFF